MKIIKSLSDDERVLIHNVVNRPPAGNALMDRGTAEAREALLKKVIDDGEHLGEGVYNYSNIDGKDLILKNGEWNTLKECFKTSAWPTVWAKIEGGKLEEKINEADEYKPKDKK